MRIENTTPFETELTGTFEPSAHEAVVVAAKATFELPRDPGGACVLAEDQAPLFFADEFGADPENDATVFENDFAPFKPRCDVLAHGPAVAPDGRPATDVAVGIRLGNWSKSFAVHGSRIWLRGATGHQVSDKRAFIRQDIGYDQAFGGTDPELGDPSRAATFEQNPCGVGYYPLRPEREGLALPNTSELNREISDHIGPHKPMSFGPLGRSWLPRRGFAGTYDEKWLEHRMPFLPDDFDPRYHQAAAPDQQIAYPAGGEPLEIVHLSSMPRLRTRLPRAQVLMTFERKSGRATQKVANLDTVLLMPDAFRMCLTWRAKLVCERDLFEIASIVVSATLEDQRVAAR